MSDPSTAIDDAGLSGNLSVAKMACRKQAANKRAELASALPDAAVRLALHADYLTKNYGKGIYAGYMPIHSELSPLCLLKSLADLGCDLALPITPHAGQPLGFRRWHLGGQLDDGPFGTKQPPASNQACTPNIILAPMLAFDASGWRLGYGGGFYDRTVAGLRVINKEVTMIGVAYDGQKLDKIPVGPYDMPLDAVLTPTGFFETERNHRNYP